MSLLKQDITRKIQVNDALSEPQKRFEAENNKKYKVKSIVNNIVYSKEEKSEIPRSLLLGFIKKLSKRKKHLKVYSNNNTSFKTD